MTWLCIVPSCVQTTTTTTTTTGLLTMDRAQIGGLDDVGIGALFGLADYR